MVMYVQDAWMTSRSLFHHTCYVAWPHDQVTYVTPNDVLLYSNKHFSRFEQMDVMHVDTRAVMLLVQVSDLILLVLIRALCSIACSTCFCAEGWKRCVFTGFNPLTQHDVFLCEWAIWAYGNLHSWQQLTISNRPTQTVTLGCLRNTSNQKQHRSKSK